MFFLSGMRKYHPLTDVTPTLHSFMTAPKQQATTHFGFKDVPVTQKRLMVDQVFSSVAQRYDVMNDMMSLGVHRLWKRHFVMTSGIRPEAKVLDLAGGTGDIATLLHRRMRGRGQIILADINADMLGVGRNRLHNRGLVGGIEYAQVNAEQLPFPDRYFDAVTIAFGLRNVTDKPAALREMQRVLKPGGKALVLEFSQVRDELPRKFYDWYSFNVLPKLGAAIADDADSYQYLAESIRKHPPQEALKSMFMGAGFAAADYRNLSGGMVAIHRGVTA